MLSFGASSYLTLPTVGRTSSTQQAMSSPGPAAGVDAELVRPEGAAEKGGGAAHQVLSPKEQPPESPTTTASLGDRFEVYARMAAVGGGAGRHCLAAKSKA